MKSLDQKKSSLGLYRKNVSRLLDRAAEAYKNASTIEQKAIILDQLMIVKADIDKEYKHAAIPRRP